MCASSLIASLGASAADRPLEHLDWHNIEGEPDWVEGSRPTYDSALGLHVVSVGGTTETTVRAARGIYLRVRFAGGEADPHDVAVWSADGLGLEVRLEPLAAPAGADQVFGPIEEESRLLRVGMARAYQGEARLELFLSARRLEDDDASLFWPVTLPWGASALKDRSELFGTSWWRGRGDWQQVRLGTPAQVRLLTRFLFPAHEAARQQRYEVALRVNGAVKRFPLHTSPDARGAWILDEAPERVGEVRAVDVDLPSSAGGIEMWAPPSVLVRLLYSGRDNYLIRPRDPAAYSKPSRLEALLERLDAAESAEERLSLALDVEAELRSTPHRDDLRRSALAAVRRVTFLRDLAPSKMPFTSCARYERYWTAADLEAWRTGGKGDGAGEPRRLAPFLRVPAGQENACTYQLPTTAGATRLRLVALSSPRAPASQGRWFIDPGDGRVRVVRFRGVAPGSWADAPLDAGAGSAGAVLLTPGCSRVAIWCDAPDLPPLAVQMHAATSRYDVTEAETESLSLERAEDTMTADTVTKNTVTGDDLGRLLADACAGRAPTSRRDKDLARRYAPIFRVLCEASRRFASAATDGVAEPVTEIPAPSRASPETASAGGSTDLSAAAVDALTRRIADADTAGDAATGLKLRQERVDALLLAGEEFLAVSQLRGMALLSPDVETRRASTRRLAELSEERGEPALALEAAAYALLELDDGSAWEPIAGAFEALGDAPSALAVRTAVERGEPSDAYCRLLWREQWTSTLRAAIGRLRSSSRKSFWEGVCRAGDGAIAEARPLLRASGELGRALADWLSAGQLLRAASGATGATMLRDTGAVMPRDTGAAAPQETAACAAWQAAYPGALEWEADPAMVDEAAGLAWLRSPGKDKYQPWHRSAPGRPVRLRIVGPASVRIDVRPILSTLPGGWRQGWIVLRGNGWERPLPWSGEDPAPGLELVGAVSEAPGRKVTDELRVGPGLHEVEVLTASVDCLVAVASGVPELQFGMFPTLTQGRCKALGLDGAAVTPLPDADALSPAAVAEQLTFEQRYDDVVALLRAGQVDAPARTLALLAFVAEQDPCLKDAAMLAAEMLEQQSPAAPGTLALRRRLLQGTSLRPTTCHRRERRRARRPPHGLAAGVARSRSPESHPGADARRGEDAHGDRGDDSARGHRSRRGSAPRDAPAAPRVRHRRARRRGLPGRRGPGGRARPQARMFRRVRSPRRSRTRRCPCTCRRERTPCGSASRRLRPTSSSLSACTMRGSPKRTSGTSARSPTWRSSRANISSGRGRSPSA
jgi:hypothetical protein